MLSHAGLLFFRLFVSLLVDLIFDISTTSVFLVLQLNPLGSWHYFTDTFATLFNFSLNLLSELTNQLSKI